MAFIRHIAITTDDPVATADFYKKYFGMKELYRQPKQTGTSGVWLSDGYIYFAVLKDSECPKIGPGQSSDRPGIHHIGFLVDDEEEMAKRLQADHVKLVRERGEPEAAHANASRPMTDHTPTKNWKFLGPNDIHFDVRGRGWNEAIKSKMQLFELKPVTSDTAKQK
jgi:catechol 2,3-dioxygenase-like lactoylglutathione lyase family enzyme